MSDDRAKLIARMRKLLELSRSDNEHEAALAAERMLEMAAKYNLELTDFGDIEDPIVRDNDLLTDRAAWIKPLLYEVSALYMCGYFATHFPADWIRKNNLHANNKKLLGGGHAHTYIKHTFVGTQANVVISKEMGLYLVDVEQTLCVEAVSRYPHADRFSVRTSFLNACTARLCARLRERRETAARHGIATERTNLPALMPLYLKAEQQYAAWCKENGIELKPSLPAHINHAAAAIDGLKAGNDIGLDQQVEGWTPVLQIGT